MDPQANREPDPGSTTESGSGSLGVILKVTSAMGLSSIAVAASAVVRYKIVALRLGTEGLGLLGLVIVLSSLLAVLFGLGISTSAVRAVAIAKDDPRQLTAASGALKFGTFVAVGVSFVATLLITGIPGLAGVSSLSWTIRVGTALAVAGAIWAANLGALLNGLGHLRQLALSTATGAVLGTIVAAGALLFGGPDLAIAAAVGAAPLMTVLTASVALRGHRLSLRNRDKVGLRRSAVDLTRMASLGVAVTVALLVGAATQLGVRLYLDNRLGLDAVGLFQASTAVASVYLSLVLGSLAAEYFPRIARHVDDLRVLRRSVDDELSLVVRLATPVILWMILLTPLLLRVLYSAEFLPAESVLRPLLAADILKVVGWAFGYVFLAMQRKRLMIVTEVLYSAVYVAMVLLLVPVWGIAVTGYASLPAYLAYVVACSIATRRLTGQRTSPRVSLSIAASFGVTCATLASCVVGGVWFLTLAVALSVATTTICVTSLRRELATA